MKKKKVVLEIYGSFQEISIGIFHLNLKTLERNVKSSRISTVTFPEFYSFIVTINTSFHPSASLKIQLDDSV
jgi:hypothetical protein